MKSFIILFVCILILQATFCQEKEYDNLKVGLNVEYSYSGYTNGAIAGPALFWEPNDPNELYHYIAAGAGIYWCKQGKVSPISSVGYYFGKLPGFIFGVSSQQYYNIETKYDTFKTDVRLSGEVCLALFGFIGYRYQHPLLKDNVSRNLSRHSVFFKIPLPLKKISNK